MLHLLVIPDSGIPGFLQDWAIWSSNPYLGLHGTTAPTYHGHCPEEKMKEYKYRQLSTWSLFTAVCQKSFWQVKS